MAGLCFWSRKEILYKHGGDLFSKSFLRKKVRDFMLTVQDEGRHDKTDERYWRESYYFNFVDGVAGVYGFSTIGWRVNEGEVDGLLMLIKDRTLWFAYPAVNRKFTRRWETVTLPDEARVGALKFEMEEPFKHWRIKLAGGKNSVDLSFSAFTPPYDYNAYKESLPKEVAAEHYEQSGLVKGMVKVRGREVKFNGTGQRDHSWGVRDWGGVDSWKWITAQFGDVFSFNVFSVLKDGVERFGGYVFDGGRNLALREAEIEMDFMGDGKTPRGAKLLLVDEKGCSHRISAQVFHVIPLKRHNAFIKECFAKFYYKGLEGCGVVERLHRIETGAEKFSYAGTALVYGLKSILGRTFLYRYRAG